MTDKATRLRNIRRHFVESGFFQVMLDALALFRGWAKLCGHHQAVDAVDSFMRFVEGGDA